MTNNISVNLEDTTSIVNNIKMIKDNVLIEVVEQKETKYKDLIHIPDVVNSNSRLIKGIIHGFGKDSSKDLKIGQEIYFDINSIIYHFENTNLIINKSENVHAKIEESKAVIL